MSNTEQLFADGVMDVVIQNGVVRMDFFSYSPTEKDAEGKANTAFAQRVVLPLPAFVQTFSAMERMMKELMDRGVVSRKGEPTDAAIQADA